MHRAEVLHCAYSYHTEPFVNANPNGLGSYLFRLQTKGHCRALVQGDMCDVGPGDLLLYKPGDRYALTVDEHPLNAAAHKVSSGDYYVFCRGAWLDEWWRRHSRPTIARIDDTEPLLSLWRMLILENRRLQHGDPELTDYLLRALVLQFDRSIAARSEVKGSPFVASRMRSFIEEHAAHSFKLEELARYVDLSVSRAVHLFKQCYGKTIIQYAQEVRLSIAEERMKYSSLTLEQIAESSGFGNYSYFYKVFQKKYGVSPSAFRQELDRQDSVT